jgi:hypothetical protein
VRPEIHETIIYPCGAYVSREIGERKYVKLAIRGLFASSCCDLFENCEGVGVTSS